MQIKFQSTKATASSRQYTIRGLLLLTLSAAVFCCSAPTFWRWLHPPGQTLPTPYYLMDDVQYFPNASPTETATDIRTSDVESLSTALKASAGQL